MASIETRFRAELRIEDQGQRLLTGLVAPFNRPEVIPKGDRYFTETFTEDSLEPFNGSPLHLDHPQDGRVDDERDMPVSPPGRFVSDATGLYGRWRVGRTPAGDELLAGVHEGRISHLSVGFLPSDTDRWSPDRSAVTRHRCLMLHVAAVPPGKMPAYRDAEILEVRAKDPYDGCTLFHAPPCELEILEERASSLSTAERKRLASIGQALPDGSYPIPDKEHLHAAAVLAASGHGDVAAAKKLIRKRARELGVDVSTLPGFGPESRTRGAVARDSVLRKIKLTEARERGHEPWRGVAFPEDAYASLHDSLHSSGAVW